MKCDDKNIKELLPAYREQALEQPEREKVEKHLESCDDCATELSLLRMMSGEAVPDPGEAFWAAMPGRVYREVQEQKSKQWSFNPLWLARRFAPPRWIFAATAVCIVVVISFFVARGLRQTPDVSSPDYELSDELLANGTVHVADLNQNELELADDWAGNELTSIAQEAGPVVLSGRSGTDIYEELAELNASEIEQLSTTIDQLEEEEG